jgi:hypothetical protein
MKFIAELAVTKEIKGTWLYYFDGKQIGSQSSTKKSITFSSPAYEVGTPHTIRVTFQGQMEGEEITSDQEIHLPLIHILYDRSEQKDQFAIRFTKVSKVEGQWGIIVRDQEGKIVDLCSSIYSKDLTYNCKLPLLKEGKYTISFVFKGTFDKMYSFANYGFIQKGILAVNDKDKPGTLERKKPGILSGDKIPKLIQEAEKEKRSQEEKSDNWYMIMMFILVVVIIILLKLKFRTSVNKFFSR